MPDARCPDCRNTCGDECPWLYRIPAPEPRRERLTWPLTGWNVINGKHSKAL